MNRYSKYRTYINNNEIYKSFLDGRNVKQINQYGTIALRYPTADELSNIQFENYVWKANDKYWKLSQQYYQDPTFWWVIGFINKKPIDSSNEPGDVLYIPTEIQEILSLIQG
jgi:hypothetical protein